MQIIYRESGKETFVRAELRTHCVLTSDSKLALPLTDTMITKLERDERVELKR